MKKFSIYIVARDRGPTRYIHVPLEASDETHAKNLMGGSRIVLFQEDGGVAWEYKIGKTARKVKTSVTKGEHA